MENKQEKKLRFAEHILSFHRWRIWNILLGLQKAIMFITSIFIVLIMCLIILFRYVFKTDLFGMEEIIVVVAIWMYFMGAAFASYKNEQIRADVASVFIKKEKYKQMLTIITSLITVAICLTITYWAVEMIQWGFIMKPKTNIYNIPLYVPQSAILIGFILMSIYSIIHLIIEIKNYMNLKDKNQI